MNTKVYNTGDVADESKAIEELHIALGFDKHYIVFIYPMLASIFHNNRNEKIVFHVIPNDMADNDKFTLVNYIRENNCDIVFHELNAEMLSRKLVYPSGTHFNIATYYRLFFPSFVYPNSKRLLYLDADIIVLGNLRELYKKDIGQNAVAAVSDPFIGKCERLGIFKDGDYFNAGVMVIDLDNWQNQQISEKALKFIEDFPEKIKFCDQDALNAVLKNSWFRLSNKYNLTQLDVRLQEPASQLVKNVLIVHFTSSNKPWNALTRNKLRYLYQFYLKLSPMRKEKKYVDFIWNFKTIWTFARIRIKEFYFDYKINKLLPIKKWEKSSLNY